MKMQRPDLLVKSASWRDGVAGTCERNIPEEVAISFTYNKTAHAVMMSTPSDLEDFAVGFSLSEGIIGSPREIEDLEIVPHTNGIELRMAIAAARDATYLERRRHLAGATGCGLCGIESLDEAMRVAPRVESVLEFSAVAIMAAIVAVKPNQTLNQQTHAVHAAAYWEADVGLIALREDVGRHNAA